MAPKKGKNQAKRNNIKIMSKTNQPKRGIKSRKLEEKPIDTLKWYAKTQGGTDLQRIDASRDWINDNPYKKDFASSTSSEADSSGYMDYAKPEGAELRSCFTDVSDECNCNCNYDKAPETKFGILKRKSSSPNSVVAKYIKSGMDHVASFIVESAIRFGEQHGVVVPDKNTPNVYEIMPPNDKRFFDDKSRRIRFKIPEKALEYEEAKKLMWRSQARNQHEGVRKSRKSAREYEASPQGVNESLQEIIPLLKKIRKAGEITRSEIDFKKLESSSERESASAPPPLERERKRQREKDKSKDRDMERSRLREMDLERERGREPEKDRRKDLERERGRARQRAKDRIKKRIRAMRRFKSAGAESEEKMPIPECSKKPWRKFRQDSLELGRQRLRASTCPRKSDEMSESPAF